MYSVERSFVPELESAFAARQFVSAAVRDTSIDLDEAILLTSELVSNAILHAQSDFEVRVDIGDHDDLFVAVVNHSPALLPVAREPSSTGGRGLAIIESIADAWGFESRADAKLVWFRLDATLREHAECAPTGCIETTDIREAKAS
jgi:two-component sensor histidine kinase